MLVLDFLLLVPQNGVLRSILVLSWSHDSTHEVVLWLDHFMDVSIWLSRGDIHRVLHSPRLPLVLVGLLLELVGRLHYDILFWRVYAIRRNRWVVVWGHHWVWHAFVVVLVGVLVQVYWVSSWVWVCVLAIVVSCHRCLHQLGGSVELNRRLLEGSLSRRLGGSRLVQIACNHIRAALPHRLPLIRRRNILTFSFYRSRCWSLLLS